MGGICCGGGLVGEQSALMDDAPLPLLYCCGRKKMRNDHCEGCLK